MNETLTAEQLSAIAGVVLSLAFSYIPGVRDWFDGLMPTIKRLIMAGLLLAVALGAFGLGCAGVLGQLGGQVGCDQAGAIDLVTAFLAALVANQAAYAISPQVTARARARYARMRAERGGIRISQR